MNTQGKDLIKFNVEQDARLNIAYEGESNRTIIEFEGWEMHDPANALLLIWNGAFDRYIPIINNRMLVTAKLASEAGEAVCCLEERNSEQEFVAKSSTFTIKVLPSPKASAEVEVIDDRLELVYEEYNKKYQEMVALESEIQTNDSERQSRFEAVKESIEDIRADLQQKVEDGYFDGKDYVLTEEDKREIADMVPGYDDSEIKAEIEDVESRMYTEEQLNKRLPFGYDYDETNTTVIFDGTVKGELDSLTGKYLYKLPIAKASMLVAVFTYDGTRYVEHGYYVSTTRRKSSLSNITLVYHNSFGKPSLLGLEVSDEDDWSSMPIAWFYGYKTVDRALTDAEYNANTAATYVVLPDDKEHTLKIEKINNVNLYGVGGKQAIAGGAINPMGSGSVGIIGGRAYNQCSVAIGAGSTSKSAYSVAIGTSSVASGQAAIAIGQNAFATAAAAISMGLGTFSEATAALALGRRTVAKSAIQMASGKFNVEDSAGIYSHIVGNGTDDNARSNSHTLDWEGNAWFKGDVHVGSTGGVNRDGGSERLIKESELAIERAKITDLERKNDALWKLSQGQAYDFQTVDGEYYEEVIPSGGHYFEPKMLGGKSVVWNQQLKFTGTVREIYGVAITDNGDGSITLNGTCSTSYTWSYTRQFTDDFVAKEGHIYLLVTGVETPIYTTASFVQMLSDDYSVNYGTSNSNPYSTIWTAPESVPMFCRIRLQEGVTYNNMRVTPQLFDLTQMFVTGNEPTSVDDPRIKWIERYAEEHPQYNEGEIVSADIDSIVERGVNLVDFDNMPILTKYTNTEGRYTNTTVTNYERCVNLPCEPNTVYTASCNVEVTGRLRMSFYDSEPTVGMISLLSKGANDKTMTLTSPSNARWVSLFFWNVPSSPDDVVRKSTKLMLEKGPVAHEYVPYHEQSYDLPNVELRSAGAVHDELDIERGVVVRRVGVSTFNGDGVVDVGVASTGIAYARINRDSNGMANTLNIRTNEGHTPTASASRVDKGVRFMTKELYLYDNRFTSVETVAGILNDNPLTLCYELAEPYEEPITVADFDLLPCEPNGSLTFENSLHIPIPSSVEYTVKLSEV